MKRYIRATNSKDYMYHDTLTLGHQKFFIYYTTLADRIVKSQMSEIHPYDDADYASAKSDGLNVRFTQNGRIIDRMTMPAYEEDDYEDFNDYVNDFFVSIAKELRLINKDVEPRMVHY